jgi:hypothetical protein
MIFTTRGRGNIPATAATAKQGRKKARSGIAVSRSVTISDPVSLRRL